jgi:hypothetical protein
MTGGVAREGQQWRNFGVMCQVAARAGLSKLRVSALPSGIAPAPATARRSARPAPVLGRYNQPAMRGLPVREKLSADPGLAAPHWRQAPIAVVRPTLAPLRRAI